MEILKVNTNSKNAVFPLVGSPITSQPSSLGNLRHPFGNQREKKDYDLIPLPTPRRFLTPEETPPGLQSLVDLEYVFMKQYFHTFEVGWNGSQKRKKSNHKRKKGHPEECDKYEVLNIFGKRIFMAVEKTEAAHSKIYCAAAQPFSLRTFSRTSETHFRKEVLQISGHPGSFGCGAEITVKYDNKLLGLVEQESDCAQMRYTVQNSEGAEVMRIVGPTMGPCCSMSKFVVVHEFDLYLSDGITHVGRIAKHWSGVHSNKEIFSRSDIWGVKFPAEYHVRLKALLLSSLFLLAYQFSEK